MMKITISRWIALLLVAYCGGEAWAAACTSTGGTAATPLRWSRTGTWSCNRAPRATDTATIRAGDYVRLDANGTASSLAVVGVLTITGNTSRTLTVGNGGINISGDISPNATGTGVITLSSTGGLTINSTLTSTTANVILQTTANQSISGTGALPNLQINTTATNTGTLTVSAALAGTGTLTNAGTLNIGGTSTVAGLDASTPGNTVDYAGAAQTVLVPAAPAISYYNLRLSGSGVKTTAGSFTVSGDLTIGAGVTLAVGTAVLTVNGNADNSGSSTGGNITLSGGVTAHTLSGNGSYANLVLNDANGAVLTGSPTVNGTLTLTTGLLNTGTNTIISGANCPASVVRTTGYVVGNLQLLFPAGGTCTYFVGDSTGYAPITVALTGASGGTLTGRVDAGDHPDTIANISRIDQTKSANHHWMLTPGTLLSGTKYDATFTFGTALDANANTNNFTVAKKDAGIWAPASSTLTRSATSTKAAGITSGFGGFAVGEPLVGVYRGVNQLIDLREVY